MFIKRLFLYYRAFFSLAAAIAVMVVSTGVAAQEKTYLAEYKLYQEALAVGDAERAAEHGRAAWQAAEVELGDHNLTAVLAYNYGQIVLFTDTEEALEALKRVERLVKEGIGDIPKSELELYLAFSYFDRNGSSRRADRLRDALLAIEAEGIEPDEDIAVMWFLVATNDINNERYEKAVISAEKSEEAIRATAPNDRQFLASAILYLGVAKLVPWPREPENIIAASNDFKRALPIFDLQEDVESFDPTLGQLLAWRAAADTAMASIGENVDDFERDPDQKSKYPVYFKIHQDRPDDCGIEWEERTPPKFPSSAASRGQIGAVLVVYDIGESNELNNMQVLAAVPGDVFNDISLRAVKNWRIKTPPANHPGCRRHLVSQFSYVLRGFE